jgi:mono/diheme cytochrome c family protein
VLYSLSTQHEIGLAVAGAIFITFSLLSSFVFPRHNPNFPGGKGLRWYLPLCGLMFLMMMSAVLIFGREKPEAEAASGTTTGQTTTTAAGPTGNAANGKAVFASAGCAACHTFTPAASKGTIGPDLDKLPDYAKQAGQPIDEYTLAAIVSPPAKYVPPGYPDVMPKTFGKTLTKQQQADLVAFLTAGA